MERVHHIVRALHEAGSKIEVAQIVAKRIKDAAKREGIKIRTRVRGNFVGIIGDMISGEMRSVVRDTMSYYQSLYPELIIGFVQ